MPDGMDDMMPEEIMTRAAWSAINDGAWDDALAIEKEPYCREIAAAIKALTDAGYVIIEERVFLDFARFVVDHAKDEDVRRQAELAALAQ